MDNINNQIDEINNSIETLTIDFIMLEKRINLLNKNNLKLAIQINEILEHLKIKDEK
jgi:hypothetical protein